MNRNRVRRKNPTPEWILTLFAQAEAEVNMWPAEKQAWAANRFGKDNEQ